MVFTELIGSDMYLSTLANLRLHEEASGAGTAQKTIVATALELRGMAFSNENIVVLLNEHHASAKCQQMVLGVVKCLKLEHSTLLQNETIAKVLRGTKKSSTTLLQEWGMIIGFLLKVGIKCKVLIRIGLKCKMADRISTGRNLLSLNK